MKTFIFLPILFVLASCGLKDVDDPGNLVPRTVVEGNLEHAEHKVALNGSTFHVETYGDEANPTIIFLHGGPGGDFRGNLRLKERYDGYSLEDEYFLVFWDQRGSGLSKRHGEDDITLAMFIEDLNQMIDTYSPDEPVLLLGHSWGAMYATSYIDTYPEKVKGAVISEAGGLTGKILEDVKGKIFNLDLFGEWLNDWAWDSQILSPVGHARMDLTGKLPAIESQPNYHAELEGDDPQPFWRYGAVASTYIQKDVQNSDGEFTFDFTNNKLDQFTTKVLFMASGNNEAIGEAHQRMQMALYPNADLVIIPDSGHDFWWTKSAEVVAAIHVYLDEIK